MGNRSQFNDIFYLFILYFFILQVLFVYITAYSLVFWGVMCVIVIIKDERSFVGNGSWDREYGWGRNDVGIFLVYKFFKN